MTESAGVGRSEYDGNGATTTFAIGFGYDSTSDVKVIHTDDEGVDTVWSLGVEYTISGTDVVVGTSPTDYTRASGEALTLISNASIKQETNLDNASYSGNSIEEMGNNLAVLIKQAAELAGRAPKLKESTRTTTPTFPEPSASKAIVWNEAGDDLENGPSTAEIETAQEYAEAAETAQAAAEAAAAIAEAGQAARLIFDAKADVEAASIADGTSNILASRGDRSSTMRMEAISAPSVSKAWQFQSTDGQWW